MLTSMVILLDYSFCEKYLYWKSTNSIQLKLAGARLAGNKQHQIYIPTSRYFRLQLIRKKESIENQSGLLIK